MLALDAVSSSNGLYSDTTTWAHTCAGGAVLFVIAGMEGAGVFNVTYGGVSMTSLGSVRRSGEEYVQAFVLSNPASGAHNIVLTASEYPSGGSVKACAWSFTGADASSPSRTPAVESGVAATPTVSGISSGSGEIIIAGAVTNGEWFTAQGSGQTQDADLTTGNCFNACHKAGAANESISWTVVWETEFAAIALSVKAFTAVTEALTGGVSGAGSFAGVLRLRSRTSGSVAAVSSGSQALRLLRKVSAVVTGSSALSASLPVKRKAVGTVAAFSSGSGAVSLFRPLAGAASSVSDVAAVVGRKIALGVQLAADAAVSAGVRILRKISGTSAAASDLVSSAWVSRRFTSSVDAQSALSGGLLRWARFQGSVEAALALESGITLLRGLTGSAGAASLSVGALGVYAILGGSIEAISFIAGSLSVSNFIMALEGAIAVSVGVLGVLRKIVQGFKATNAREILHSPHSGVRAEREMTGASQRVSIEGLARMIRKWR